MLQNSHMESKPPEGFDSTVGSVVKYSDSEQLSIFWKLSALQLVPCWDLWGRMIRRLVGNRIFISCSNTTFKSYLGIWICLGRPSARKTKMSGAKFLVHTVFQPLGKASIIQTFIIWRESGFIFWNWQCLPRKSWAIESHVGQSNVTSKPSSIHELIILALGFRDSY